MTKGQTRVLVLLGILLALEAVRQPAIKNFFSGLVSTVTSNIGSTVAPSGSSQSIAQQVQQPAQGGKCPPGYVMSGNTCYNVKGV